MVVPMNRTPRPILGRNVYVHPTAFVTGDVVLGDETTLMPFVVVRGDIAPIRIGPRVNLQDAVIVHTPHGEPLEIGAEVGVGHRAVIHGRRIGPRSLIGIGAVLLDHCRIGARCIVAAGSVVPPRTTIPDDSVVMGIPARVVRRTEAKDLAAIDHVVQSYLRLGREYAAGRFPNIPATGTNPPADPDAARAAAGGPVV